jgi:hypothetical protein
MDETPIEYLEPGNGETKQGYLLRTKLASQSKGHKFIGNRIGK